MAIKVSELESKTDRGSLSSDQDILIVDQTENELFTMSVTAFRGSSVFYSETAPSDTPEDTDTFPSYMTGDTFYYDSGDGIIIYEWDDEDNVWVKIGNANGNRIWTSEELSDDLDDSLNISILSTYTHDYCNTGDLFFNPDRAVLYGPYDGGDGGVGFNFSGEDFDVQNYSRGSQVNAYTADEYKKDFTDLDSVFTDVSDNNNTLYSPKAGDQIWLKKANDNGHGGFLFTFTLSDYNTSTETDHVAKVQESFEANREYFRSSQLVAVDSQPEQDNNEYREGDSVVDSANGVLYSGYVEDYENDLEIGSLFTASLSLKGKDLNYSEDDPVINDSSYVSGDFIFINNKETPRMHGPYEFGASSDYEAWPLYSVLRAPYDHRYLSTTTVVESFSSATYPVDSDGVMIVDTDTWTKVYGLTDLDNAVDDTKEVTLSDGAVVDYDTNTINWGSSTKNKRPSKFWKQDADTQPLTDDDTYYEDDFIITSAGSVYGPYSEDESSNSESWPLFTTIAANITYHATEVDTDYTPDVNNNSDDWGGSLIVEGDTLIAYFANSSTGKTKEYYCTATDSANSNAITWLEIQQENTIHTYGGYGWPEINDADYLEGDYIINKSGIKFGPYVEYETEVKTAWPFFVAERGTSTFRVEGVILTSEPTTPTTPYDSSGTFIQDLIYIEGDILEYETDEGKVKGIRVDSVDYDADTITFGDFYNVNPTVTWNSNDTSQVARDDNTYSEGDYVINANAVMYGPYVEYQTEDSNAWPLKSSLRDNIGVIVDTGSIDVGTNWQLVVENGILQIEEL